MGCLEQQQWDALGSMACLATRSRGPRWICIVRHCSTWRLTSTGVIYTTRYLLGIGFHLTPAFSRRGPSCKRLICNQAEKTKGFATLTRTIVCFPVNLVCAHVGAGDSAVRSLENGFGSFVRNVYSGDLASWWKDEDKT